ncbi:MAG: endolytic transglycosylase MltG [Candidatus Nealsonbacteria bacterium]
MKRHFIKIILIIVGVFLLLPVFLPKDPFSKEEVLFKIEKGQGSRDIAMALERKGLVSWGPIFRIYVLTVGVSNKLQAGEYSLSPSMNMPGIAAKLARGEVLKEKITIIEGWNLRDVGFYFENKGMFQAEEVWEAAGFPAIDYRQALDLPLPVDFSDKYEFLKEKPDWVGLEGYLFPDTYEIKKGATVLEIIEKQLANFEKKITPEMEQEIGKQGKTLFEIITMASLIEKEVRSLDDKKIVSGIFSKRIKQGYPLQSCASIAYITGIAKFRYSFEETRVESPFNTYLYYGLPPGPVSNPGLDSIMAAIYSKESPYFYYLSTPEGETIFSRTLAEHNSAIEKYLK